MAGSSNPCDVPEKIHDLEYLYASNANVSNFVSVKLSSDRNYHLWKKQMLCLMKTHNMDGIVDNAYVCPRVSSKEIMDKYDNLLKGWIFGSASENVLGAVIDLDSAKDVWNKLKSFYDASTSHEQAPTKSEMNAETEPKDINALSAQTHTKLDIKFAQFYENYFHGDGKEKLRKATIKGDWLSAEAMLKEDKSLVKMAINSDGSTVLHIAVGIGNNKFLKELFSYISDEDVVEMRTSDGSTALHIAAIVGNTYAATLLVNKNKQSLQTKDLKGEEPLHKAYKHMHLNTIGYLLKAVNDDGKSKLPSFPIGGSVHPGVDMVDLLVNAISAKEYNIASQLIERFPKFASKNDNVLMAIAKSFPSGDYEKTIVYGSWTDLSEVAVELINITIINTTKELFIDMWRERQSFNLLIKELIAFVLKTVLVILFAPIFMTGSVLLILWGKSTILVEPITHTQKRMKEMDEAENVLELICDEIDKLEFTGTYHPYYARPLLEAACQNAHKVVDEILYRSHEAIISTDKSGYDIIQLAVIHRSERIYNLIYDIGERRNVYRTIADSSMNNILHLAGRLAPSRELNHRTGAALQLQRELQWREEVKKVVFPTYITQENIFKETPDMVFTREHENLVKEGEQWMKTTAESCSITAALITTVVFAAAITVPGGSDQQTGIPVFTKEVAFTIFAVSDAISLCASSTALLVFLSILTARFAEQDFLVSLPRRLLIGLCALLLSAISMMVAFSATLFLVFCHQKPWMLAPICGLSLVPISVFVALQFPLIVDLYRSTYLRIFGPRKRGKRARFNPDSIRLFFGN